MAGWFEWRRSQDRRPSPPPEFHSPTFSTNIMVLWTETLMMLVRSAFARLKARDAVYRGTSQGLILMGHQVRRRDVIGGILGRHPRYRGILGWHGQDIGAGAVGCLWYPIVSTEGPGSTRPRLISAFQGLGITRSPSR